MKVFPFVWAALLAYDIIMVIWYLSHGHFMGLLFLPLAVFCGYKLRETLKYLKS